MGRRAKTTPKRVAKKTVKVPAKKVVKSQDSFFEKLIGGKPGQSKRIAWWHLWVRIFANSQSRGHSTSYPERRYNIYSTGNSLLSGKNNITVMYSLDAYPAKLPIGYVGQIREAVKSNTRVSFISEFNPTVIDWNDPRMIARLRNYKTMDEDLSGADIDEYNYRQNIAATDTNYLRKQSILYLSESDVKRQRQLFRYRRVMLVSGQRGPAFDEDLRLIENRCAALGLQMNRVSRNIKGALTTMSPLSKQFSPRVYKDMGNNVIPDEMIARFSDYLQGKIGTSGIYMGTDIDSGDPVLKVFKKSDEDPENILCLAETGWGKSFFIKTILIQLFSKARTIGTIMDIEGFEYLPIAQFMANRSSVVQLNMGEGRGAYFDPVEIVYNEGSSLDEAADSFSDTTSFTTSLFNTLLGDMGNHSWASTIVSEAVAGLYTSLGITADDPQTWIKSKGLTIFDVYRRIREEQVRVAKKVEEDYRSEDEDYLKTLTLIRGKLSQYFEPDGARRYVFSHRVTLDDIQKAKLVVCSFGMASKTPEQVDPVQMGLVQISAANISRIRSLYAKSQGLFNVKVWEELQRWKSFPGSASILTTSVTGGRKLGDISFILSNDPTMFMGNNDTMGLFNNITSFMIGNINDAETRKEIVRRLNVEPLLADLTRLSTESGDTESFNSENVDVSLESPYRRAFLTRLDHSVTSMNKVRVPSSIAKSDLLKTGSSVKPKES